MQYFITYQLLILNKYSQNNQQGKRWEPLKEEDNEKVSIYNL